jgi:hypothetical protein
MQKCERTVAFAAQRHGRMTAGHIEAGAPERALFARVGAALYGPNWQGCMARALGVSDRSVRYWLIGDHPIPARVWRDLPGLIEGHRAMLAEISGTITTFSPPCRKRSNLTAERV